MTPPPSQKPVRRRTCRPPQFDDRDLRPLPEDIGYRGPIACNAAGITYRQLDYWAHRAGGTVHPQCGRLGSQRLYSFRDILVPRIVKRLIDTGSLPNIRAAVKHLSDRGDADLAQITLMSDGASIYECRSEHEVIDLVRGGQGVFGTPSAVCGARSKDRCPHCPANRPTASTSCPTEPSTSWRLGVPLAPADRRTRGVSSLPPFCRSSCRPLRPDIQQMLTELGFDDPRHFISAVVPPSIRDSRLQLPDPCTESDALDGPGGLAARNQLTTP